MANLHEMPGSYRARRLQREKLLKKKKQQPRDPEPPVAGSVDEAAERLDPLLNDEKVRRARSRRRRRDEAPIR